MVGCEWLSVNVHKATWSFQPRSSERRCACMATRTLQGHARSVCACITPARALRAVAGWNSGIAVVVQNDPHAAVVPKEPTDQQLLLTILREGPGFQRGLQLRHRLP